MIRFPATWWRHQMEIFPRYWSFVRGIHRSTVNSPHKGQWRGPLMFPLNCAFNKRLNKKIARLVIWNAITLIMTSLYLSQYHICWTCVSKVVHQWFDNGLSSVPSHDLKTLRVWVYCKRTHLKQNNVIILIEENIFEIVVTKVGAFCLVLNV